jgi:carbohydrate esterase-like sialic acid-specific acetylesterase
MRSALTRCSRLRARQNGGVIGNWGPEAEFSYLMRRAHPERNVYLIKYGIGATQLAKDPRISDWSPDSDRSDLFGQVQNIIELAKRSFTLNSRIARVRDIIWMQGENDASAGRPLSSDYSKNLKQWALAARSRWGDNDSRLIIGSIFKAWGHTPEDHKLVVDAQEEIVSVTSNSALISNENVANGGHFTPDQTIEFGRKIFEITDTAR